MLSNYLEAPSRKVGEDQHDRP